MILRCNFAYYKLVLHSRWQTVLQVQCLAANPSLLKNVSVHLTMAQKNRQSKNCDCCAWHEVHAVLLDWAELFAEWTMMEIRRCRWKSSRKDCMTPVWSAAMMRLLKYSKRNYPLLNNSNNETFDGYIRKNIHSSVSTQTKVEQSICLSFWLNYE